MSSHNPPLKCDEVKKILKQLGFEWASQVGSHEHYKRNSKKHSLVKVTVDCPKAPFSQDLIKLMAAQAKLSKRQFYRALNKKQAAKIAKATY